jgi:tRNA-5-methyluridine54 2-sulfurtransferase
VKVRLRNPDRVEEVAGPATVRDVLQRLGVNPETALVISDGTLVTAGITLPDDAEVEVRPVISGGSGGPSKCHVCRRTAVIELARHRTALCADDYVDFVRAQVRHAIDRYRMLSYDDRILVAVSGGKDSLALWDLLTDMGYHADGLYLGLGIGGYSNRSQQVVEHFAAERGLTVHVRGLAEEHGFAIPDAARARERTPCGTCGLSKRYVFNQMAQEGGYDVMATGHNLDDEASQLLGNVLRWQTPFLARQSPALPATDNGLARKVKPLYRLTERETAAYCVIKGIDYVVEECPLVAGNTVLRYKDALNAIEQHAPGTKAQFLYGFLERVQERHFGTADVEAGDLVPCAECGLPTVGDAQAGGETGAVCAFCRTRGRLLTVLSTR